MGLRRSHVDLRAANNAKIDVQGVADATISALLPSGERFRTTTTAYVVKNVDEVDLSLDVLVGLRIVNKQFPTAGAGNQHGAQQGAWDRTGTITEQLPHASYSVRVDGSGRISQRTRQHLRQFIPNDSRATRNAERTFNSHAEQGLGRQSASQSDDSTAPKRLPDRQPGRRTKIANSTWQPERDTRTDATRCPPGVAIWRE